ncbi:hypothetical protein PFF91_37475 [Burkholderia cenocepacia]|nr:hypothetical protein [Burkholderia cenocepacia]MDA3682021.1 hypothetical protein [Burkholderia cenocepacia]MDA3689223.1 hypothetical protein [Burkholderia cenocepacia]MDA3696704.1 hypothetical protein [Burkholderia cenocepacia]MDF3599569.1 hypothetical protein [Burkholderia cenocepacia]
MTTQTEAIANADAQRSRAGLYTYSGVLNELRNVLEAVKAGVPETVGYGEIGKPAFAHGWTAAMEHVYGELAAARALLREVDGADHAPGEPSTGVDAGLLRDARPVSAPTPGEALYTRLRSALPADYPDSRDVLAPRYQAAFESAAKGENAERPGEQKLQD